MTYTLDQAMKAMAELRREAGMKAESFPIQAFVGMLSDEIEQVRKLGKTDEHIARMISSASGAEITAEEIAENYAPPKLAAAVRECPHAVGILNACPACDSAFSPPPCTSEDAHVRRRDEAGRQRPEGNRDA